MKLLLFFPVLFFTAGVLYLSYRTTLTPAFPPTPILRSYIDDAKGRIAYYQKGIGIDVLLIHGTPGSIEDWEHLYNKIDLKKYRVTSYDRFGHGATSADGFTGNIEESVETALSLLKILKLNDAIVVGHSFGGSTALAVAQRNDPNVKGFVSIGPPAYQWPAINSVYYPMAMPVIGPVFAEMLIPFVANSMIKSSLINCFANDEGKIPPGFISFRQKLWSQTKNVVAKAKEMVNLDSDLKRTSQRMDQIRIPGIIITGSADQGGIVAGGWLKSCLPLNTKNLRVSDITPRLKSPRPS